MPRHETGAVIHDEDLAIARVLEMVRSRSVAAGDGSRVPLAAETVCIHGDHPGAAAFARRIRQELEANRVSVQAPRS
ncbi:LamB/YcsF family protein [compost metagenome]